MGEQQLNKIRKILAYAEEKEIDCQDKDFFSRLIQEDDEVLEYLLPKDQSSSKERAISFYFNKYLDFDEILSKEILKELSKPNKVYTDYFSEILENLSKKFQEDLDAKDAIALIHNIQKMANHPKKMESFAFLVSSIKNYLPQFYERIETMEHLNLWLSLFLTQREEVVDTIVRVYCYVMKHSEFIVDPVHGDATFEPILYRIGWKSFDKNLISMVMEGKIQVGVFGKEVDELCEEMKQIVDCPTFSNRTVYMHLIAKLLTLNTQDAKHQLLDLFTNTYFKYNFIESSEIDEEYKEEVINRVLNHRDEPTLPTICHFVKKLVSIRTIEVLPKEQFLYFLDKQLPLHPTNPILLDFLDATLPILFSPSLCNHVETVMNLIQHLERNQTWVVEEITKFYHQPGQRNLSLFELIALIKLLSPITDEWQWKNMKENILEDAEFLKLESDGKVSMNQWKRLIQESGHYRLSYIEEGNQETVDSSSSEKKQSKYSSYISMIDRMMKAIPNSEEKFKEKKLK